MNDFNLYDDVEALERYLNLPKGALINIPIYARKPAVDAIIKVKEMEKASLFRPGLYYIVLVDLCSNTAFNAKYGDKEGDVRTQWFHTAVIESIGEIALRNYVAFSKTIGDASLIIFSSFLDVVEWSDQLSINLSALSDEYLQRAHEERDDLDEAEIADLLHLMAKDLNISFSKTDIIQPSYYPRGYEMTEEDQQQLRKLLLELLRNERSINMNATVYTPPNA